MPKTEDDPKGKTYILRDIPPELWRQVKSKAALEGKPLRALFLGWLASYQATPAVKPLNEKEIPR